ncbi:MULTISPECIES: defense against restriction DarA-related protein [Vibrio]|uniref:defense against restriction DarA-related protein n=1 Tax=Vibrio TaxID=662 RepID=UPI00111CE658|nr:MULTISPECIES: hypothetical protein [Vibrio]MDW1954282.1 hypothetical protein [Vibrio sp. Vb0562]MDW2371432.1 hypothetical protein [Vibrio sp. 1078-1]NOI45577.1 hypothetical protein [Vibrio alginolyticus]TOP83523.1 hypothetical protein CGH08_21125 [Vibrio parahaemolyticus]TOQ29720.1 hypothetical protein CGG99_08945 [Vibrio parahaemolyticus]
MSRLFASRQSQGYVVVDFNDVTERGLKSLITELKRAGEPVNDVQADNKARRKDMQQVKQAKFYFENGQSMTLFIGSEGDVYQLQLNSTKQPLPDATSDRELARDMANMLKRNQAKFDKQLARKANKAIKDTSNSKPLTRSVSKRLEEAKSSISALQENQQAVVTSLNAASQQSASMDEEIARLSETLAAEKTETQELEKQLEEVK